MKHFANNADYYDALKRITQYQTVDQLRRHSEKEYGLTFPEALEYAYENVKEEARRAIKGKRRPETEVKRKAQSEPASAPPLPLPERQETTK